MGANSRRFASREFRFQFSNFYSVATSGEELATESQQLKNW